MSPPDLQHVDANGIRFAYRALGDGPPVLCVHGFPDGPGTWDALMPALADAGFRAIAPALRGYAPSSIPEPPDYAPLTLGADVVALIDALAGGRAALVGHDWGAMAVHAAVAAAPEKVTKLVTVGIPHPRVIKPSLRLAWKARHFLTFQWRSRAVKKLKKRDGAFVDALYRRWSPSWDVPPQETAAFRASLGEPGRAEAALGYYWDFAAHSRGARAKALNAAWRVPVTVPTLAFAGGDDGAAFNRLFEQARRCYEAPYDWVEVADAGHWIHREQPAQFNARVVAFLQGAA